jgi:alpha-glucosidase
MSQADRPWWQTSVFYQVYPRSFADGNGDGVGDLPGLIARLDYLADLGIDAIWLSPHYPSPNRDCGYDISDFCGVAPEYGTLDDFRLLLRESHRRGMHLILDLVLNHTSNEHPWFVESRSSRDNPKADWYVWVDSPPNNWQSCFDGEAWTYDSLRGQYYYHYFMKEQPDLNWHNPEVKRAMWDAARFWLDLGIDGFRLDAVGTIFEDPGRRPHPVPMNLAGLRHASDLAHTTSEKRRIEGYWRDMFKFQLGQPAVHDLMKELRAIMDEYGGDRMLVGEDDEIEYLGNGQDELHLVFNFPLMSAKRITPPHVRKNQRTRLRKLSRLPARPGWPCNTLGNHDTSRLFTAFGDGQHDVELARLNAALVLTLKGTPFLYNGEEVGMSDLMLTDIAQVRDTMGAWYYQTLVTEMGVSPYEAMIRTAGMTRDKNRTPMQWSRDPNAGFCPPGVTPWLPVHPNFESGVNVRDQEDHPGSLLSHYKRLLRVRRQSPALVHGEYEELHPDSRDYLAFLRYADGQLILIVLNYSGRAIEVNFREGNRHGWNRMRVLFSSVGRRSADAFPNFRFEPFEVFIAEVAGEE